MPSTEERVAVLQWAAGLRGATTPDEALDWMEDRGLIQFGFAPDEVTLTEEGIERADRLYEAMVQDSGSAADKRKRTNVVLLALVAALVLWRRKR